MAVSKRLVQALVCLIGLLSATGPARAEHITGKHGSPSATTTIPGNTLPAPAPKFGGVIKETTKGSVPWWPPRVVPPKGAPNVLLVLVDESGGSARRAPEDGIRHAQTEGWSTEHAPRPATLKRDDKDLCRTWVLEAAPNLCRRSGQHAG